MEMCSWCTPRNYKITPSYDADRLLSGRYKNGYPSCVASGTVAMLILYLPMRQYSMRKRQQCSASYGGGVRQVTVQVFLLPM